jgi:plastocyanin domain-containing protein
MTHLAYMKALIVASGIALAAGAADGKPRKAVKKAVQEVQVTVTRDGFQPAEIKVKAGDEVRLVITRKVERTCATEIVFKALKLEKKLPLETPVIVELGAPDPGELRFGCAMDMIAGKVIVE